MKKMITNPVNEETSSFLLDMLNSSIEKLKAYHVSFSSEERKGNRNMSEGREGIVRLMSTIAIQHADSLPRNEDPQEMVTLLDAYLGCSKTAQAIKQLNEMVQDILLAVGMDLMATYDRYNGFLQTARSGKAALDYALKDIDNYNSRFGKSTTSTEDTPATEVTA